MLPIDVSSLILIYKLNAKVGFAVHALWFVRMVNLGNNFTRNVYALY